MLAGLYDTDIMFRRWRRHNVFYELSLLDKIRSYNARGMYIDVGANLGNHSVFFANFCKATTLLTIEAHPAIHKVLALNLRNYVKIPYVSFNCAAAAVDGGHVTMSGIDEDNVGATAIVNHHEGPITTVTIDGLVADHVDVAVIKMDIEGYERHALLGALQTIDRCRPLVAMEAWTEEELQALDDIIRVHGYEIVFRTEKNPASYLWMPKE
jgi:FkbM family methyltransferase